MLYTDNHVICKQEQFCFFLSMCMPFIYFSCFIPVARTSTTMLNESGERDIPALFLITGGKHSAFHPSGMRLAVSFGVFLMLFIKLRAFPSLPVFLRVFIMT